MSIGATVRRNLFWMRDRLRNGSRMRLAYDQVCQVMESRNPATERLVERQLEKLLKHTAATCPYYAEYQGVVDLADWPVIDKMTLIDNADTMASALFAGQRLHEQHTSGSTGIPFTVRQDPAKRQRVIAEIKATNEIAHYPSHERMLYVAAGVKAGDFSWWQQFREDIWRINVGVNDTEKMREIERFIIRRKPYAIHASASNLVAILEHLRAEKVPSEKLRSVRTIITGGEAVPATLREGLEETFGPQCTVYVKYSNEEMGIYGMDTGQDTPYILNWADYWFEILKMDSDEPAEMGELGRIVITDLYNFATPMIRYDTGDIGSLAEVGVGKWPVMDQLSGKRRDLLFDTRGFSISGPAVTNLLKHVENVRMYQVVQTDEKAFTYRVVGIDGEPTEAQMMLPELRELLGEDADITVEVTDEIPETSSQKRRYTINEWRPQ